MTRQLFFPPKVFPLSLPPGSGKALRKRPRRRTVCPVEPRWLAAASRVKRKYGTDFWENEYQCNLRFLSHWYCNNLPKILEDDYEEFLEEDEYFIPINDYFSHVNSENFKPLPDWWLKKRPVPDFHPQELKNFYANYFPEFRDRKFDYWYLTFLAWSAVLSVLPHRRRSSIIYFTITLTKNIGYFYIYSWQFRKRTVYKPRYDIKRKFLEPRKILRRPLAIVKTLVDKVTANYALRIFHNLILLEDFFNLKPLRLYTDRAFLGASLKRTFTRLFDGVGWFWFFVSAPFRWTSYFYAFFWWCVYQYKYSDPHSFYYTLSYHYIYSVFGFFYAASYFVAMHDCDEDDDQEDRRLYGRVDDYIAEPHDLPEDNDHVDGVEIECLEEVGQEELDWENSYEDLFPIYYCSEHLVSFQGCSSYISNADNDLFEVVDWYGDRNSWFNEPNDVIKSKRKAPIDLPYTFEEIAIIRFPRTTHITRLIQYLLPNMSFMLDHIPLRHHPLLTRLCFWFFPNLAVTTNIYEDFRTNFPKFRNIVTFLFPDIPHDFDTESAEKKFPWIVRHYRRYRTYKDDYKKIKYFLRWQYTYLKYSSKAFFLMSPLPKVKKPWAVFDDQLVWQRWLSDIPWVATVKKNKWPLLRDYIKNGSEFVDVFWFRSLWIMDWDVFLYNYHVTLRDSVFAFQRDFSCGAIDRWSVWLVKVFGIPKEAQPFQLFLESLPHTGAFSAKQRQEFFQFWFELEPSSAEISTNISSVDVPSLAHDGEFSVSTPSPRREAYWEERHMRCYTMPFRSDKGRVTD